MPRPKILQELDKCVQIAGEDTPIDETLPVDADTLQGHPASYFASKTEVNQAIANYVATVLGTSY